MTRVTFPSSVGESSGYLEEPSGSGRGPAIVVVHEWWGANEQMISLAKKWAAEGFLALVPDLYHGKVVPIGQSDAADAAMQALDFPKAIQEIAASVAFLKNHERSNGKVVVTGYCMGGALTLATAVNVRGLSCAIPFYGLPGDLPWEKVDAPIQAHFATIDEWATVAGAEKVKAGVPTPMELHVYEAQHAFCNDQRPEVYNPEAAALSWQRAVAFAKQHTA
jgi:carboxymethylenebutenolidase